MAPSDGARAGPGHRHAVAVLGPVVVQARAPAPQPSLVTVAGDPTGAPRVEVTSVADDSAVVFRDGRLVTYGDLPPDTVVDLDGVEVRTLPRPGELLCRFATVNDVHFGETVCGVLDGLDVGPTFRSEPGEPPYPQVMNRAAIEEIAAIDPAVVVVKGDLTADGTEAQYAEFLEAWGTFGDRLVVVRGNHDAYHGATFAATPTRRVDLPGVVLAVLDTSRPGHANGRVTAEQLAWLEDVAADAAAEGLGVLVFGHHHVWNPASRQRPDTYFGIVPDDSERLVEVFARHRNLLGYFAGHTHRNRRRTFPATGPVPWVEVACVKDFPGAWAEYRVHEGGILQVFHRIGSPEALAWTEKTRGMFAGTYDRYAFGALSDRSFLIGGRGR